MPRRSEWAPPKKAARPRNSLLLPGLEGVVVALGAVEPDAEERPRHPRRQPIGRRPLGLLVDRHREEVGRRMVGPEAVVGDQVADDRVIPPILQDRVAEPGHEPSAAELEERAVLGADEHPGESLGQVVGTSAVVQTGRRASASIRRPAGRDSNRRTSSSEGIVPQSDSAGRRITASSGAGRAGASPCSAHRFRNDSSTRATIGPRSVPATVGRDGVGDAATFPAGRNSPPARPTVPAKTTTTNATSRIETRMTTPLPRPHVALLYRSG